MKHIPSFEKHGKSIATAGLNWRRFGWLASVLLASVVCFFTVAPAAAEELIARLDDSGDVAWATYRGDVGRSGSVAAELSWPLQLAWTYRPAHPPQPAWSAPARGSYWQELQSITPRVVADRTFHPVIVGGSVFFASSSDDQVVCLDASTGAVNWIYVTDGPIRYAPVVADARVFVGSDDGNVYCLNAETGSLIWKRRLGLKDRRIPGNDRIISIWPVRTGVLVDEGTVYACAGLYPNQGVVACALNAQDGEVIWKEQLTQSPQGYLLASKTHLYIPTGRGNPFALDKKTGQFVRSFDGIGGAFAIVKDGELAAGPGNDGSLQISDTASKERLIQFQGSQMAVTPSDSYLLGRGRLRALDRVRFMALTRDLNRREAQREALKEKLKDRKRSNSESVARLRQELGEVAQVIDQLEQQRKGCYRWDAETKSGSVLIACANAVIVGGDNKVAAYATDSGELVWRHDLKGRPLGMAITKNRLVVTNEQGEIFCFTSRAADEADSTVGLEPKKNEIAAPSISDEITQRARQLLTASDTTKGYCLIVGVVDGRLAYEIAKQSELRVVAFSDDEAAVRLARENLIKWGAYGSRVTVHHVDPEALPVTNYIANFVTTELTDGARDLLPWPASEINRLLRPYGGVAWFPGDASIETRGALSGAGEWTHQFADSANTANSGDQRINRHVQLQWFGGPGPQHMVDRHLRAPAPLCVAGRLIVPGENSLIGVDAYNGTVLWQLDVPESQRYSMPYDAGYIAAVGREVFMSVKDACWVIDAATGKQLRKLSLPAEVGAEAHWGYAGLYDGQLFGSAQKPTASRTKPSRSQIDVDYTNEQPVVTGDGVFCVNPLDGRQQWVHQNGVVINPTITVNDGSVFFVECRGAKAREHATGRIRVSELLADEAFVVALDSETGKIRWQRPLDESLRKSRNILYLQHSKGRLIASGSHPENNDSQYSVCVLDSTNGERLWHATYERGKEGAFGHGEQVHHPVILGDRIVAEPVLYRLEDGERVSLNPEDPNWRIIRPGHSCGTMSGASDCVFFRADNPTLLDLHPKTSGGERFQKLAPSRTGCWINVIPAAGLVLIPEASASCVCHYSLQTSMAFLPIQQAEGESSDPSSDVPEKKK